MGQGTDLILWRHAEAEDGNEGGDLARALTATGQRQAERMARWLNAHLPPSARIVVSPALRCQQTAAALGRGFETVAEIGPSSNAQRLVAAIGWPAAAAPVLVVGHQPTLGQTVALLLTGKTQGWSVEKAAVWWLRSDAGGIFLRTLQSTDFL